MTTQQRNTSAAFVFLFVLLITGLVFPLEWPWWMLVAVAGIIGLIFRMFAG